ncbi:hypothetical protein [Microvirga solisilvae]|uniref:hypothetical protein n=1 Tax=Microvirga solisilvae TaxID=2919498 RepID=UPI001FAFEE78|nr:hypothetical protein [Microvirga solisilvae]
MLLSIFKTLLTRSKPRDQSSWQATAPMSGLRFEKLNKDWNAEPNAPNPKASLSGADVLLEFVLNAQLFKQFEENEIGVLRFTKCVKYRIGATNDEGWYRGQCRYSKVVPQWGEFYEIHGDDPARDLPTDWVPISSEKNTSRHFLFYFRDQTFEAIADDWAFDHEPRNALLRGALHP